MAEYSLCKDNIICCHDDCTKCANEVYERYKHLQANSAPVVHARWKAKEYWNRRILYKAKQCTACNYCVSPRLAHNYCPHCGAKMEAQDG